MISAILLIARGHFRNERKSKQDRDADIFHLLTNYHAYFSICDTAHFEKFYGHRTKEALFLYITLILLISVLICSLWSR